MAETEPENFSEVDSALLDVDLFLKYNAVDRAVAKLRAALEKNPRSIRLRERLRSIATGANAEEASRQCLALASLYIEREDLQTAHDRLLEAKQLNPRINIAPGLNAIKRARRPDLPQQPGVAFDQNSIDRNATLAGDISAISLFDAVQVIENARLTGPLQVSGGDRFGRILFNDGRIVGAEAEGLAGEEAFRKIVEVTTGAFEFNKASQPFPVTINAASNTNLLLDSLRQIDEENKE
jgi:tetratricopeptide (TPR) repeat protein